MVTTKEKTQLGYLVIGILVLAFIGHFAAWWTIPGIPKTLESGDDAGEDKQDIDAEMRSNYLKGIGKFEVQTQGSDSCDISTSRTLATNFNVIWYRYVNGKYVKAVTETTGTDYVTYLAEDGGYAWIAVEIPSAQAYYVDYQKTLDDPYVTGVQYFDIDEDNTKEFVFQYDVKGHSIPSSGYPVLSFYTYIITYDSSFAIGDLANATGIGATTTTKWYEYYASISAEKKGIALYKVEFKVTTTDETKVRLKSMTVPGFGTLTGDAFDKQYTSTEIKWIYTFSNNFYQSQYLTRMPKESTKEYFNTEVEWTLVDNDDLLVTWTLYELVAQTEAGISDTDTFYAQHD